MANELPHLGRFLVAALKADAALVAALPGGIWWSQPPQGATYPLVVLVPLASADIIGQGRDARLGSEPVILAKVIAEGGSPGPISAAADRLDAAMEAVEGSIAATATAPQLDLMGFARQTTINYTENTPGGKVYYHVGGTYRGYINVTR